jgi:hypothetical protein
MAIDGKTQYDISKFNIDREAITNPDWEPAYTINKIRKNQIKYHVGYDF